MDGEDEPAVLQVVVASTRPGRIGLAVGRWVERVARAHGAFAVELVDLAEVDLPLLDEPNHPRLGDYVHDHTRAWSATVDRADAFVFVTPEYNHGYNAALKNAIDFLYREWQDKPVAFVSYGGISGGTRAVTALESVVIAVKMIPIVEAVPIPFVHRIVDDDGELEPDDPMGSRAQRMLDALARWTARSRSTG